MDDLLSDAVKQLFRDQCTPQVVREIEAGASPSDLWRHIEDSGFADALVGEDAGGAGLGLAQVFPLFELCGRFALPVPLAETMLARALLARCGAARPTGSIALAQGSFTADGAVVCDTVRAGRVADWVLAQVGSGWLLLAAAAASKSGGGFCLDASLIFPPAAVAVAVRLPATQDVRTLQACIYAAQLAGALVEVFERTLQYANERDQFGRPIGKFQTIQHQLAVVSEHVFASRMAAQLGCCSGTALPDRLRAAVAKARASEAAVEVAALCHSIHGAIGFTEEFDLQLYTRRLHAWRQAGGSESYWHGVAGAELVEHQAIALDLVRHITNIH
jgi:acyl-CoA dehydrogenase